MKRSRWLAVLALAPLAWGLTSHALGRAAHARSGVGSPTADVARRGAIADEAPPARELLADDSGAASRRAPAPAEPRSAPEAARERMDAVRRGLRLRTAAEIREETRRRVREGAEGTYIDDVVANHHGAIARWPERLRRPLRVWVSAEPALWDFDSSFTGRVREAFAAWETTGIPVRFRFVADSAGADVHVGWVDRFAEPISGKTIWSRNDGWWIIDARIVLAVRHSNGDPLDAPAVHAIALHEIGHLLGLDHTDDAGTIMTPRVRVRALSEADRRTVRLLYTLPAGSVRDQ